MQNCYMQGEARNITEFTVGLEDNIKIVILNIITNIWLTIICKQYDRCFYMPYQNSNLFLRELVVPPERYVQTNIVLPTDNN
jgi:hypothetical protein